MGIRCDGDLTSNAGYPLCDGEWITEPDQLTQLYELLNQAFSTPAPEDLVMPFMAGLTIPLIAYLVAYGYGAVIKFINQKD